MCQYIYGKFIGTSLSVQGYSNIFTTSITQYLLYSHFYIQALFEPLHRLI